MTELKYNGCTAIPGIAHLSLPLSFPFLPFLFSPTSFPPTSLLFPIFFSAQPKRMRQMAAHIESGSAIGYILLKGSFSLHICQRACSLWELLGFSIILYGPDLEIM